MNSIARMMAPSVGVLLVGVTAACGTAPNAMSPPIVPAAIAVPAGNKLAFMLKGSGLLDYECRARPDSPGSAEWAPVGPEAVLRDRSDAIVGRYSGYSGGPTWEYGDGSKVTGQSLAVAPAPTPGNLPWQLVQAAPASGPGALSGVTYIQRVNTTAGMAPDVPCTTARIATRQQVRYSADYLFYKG